MQCWASTQWQAGHPHSRAVASHPPFLGIPSSPAHPGYLLALAQLHISMCVLCCWAIQMHCLHGLCVLGPQHTLEAAQPLCWSPTLGRASCQVSILTALGLQGRLQWMDAGAWEMHLERMHPGKNASRDDLVLQPPGRVALLSWACVPGCAAKLTAVHWQAVLYKISQPTTVQHNQVISSS